MWLQSGRLNQTDRNYLEFANESPQDFRDELIRKLCEILDSEESRHYGPGTELNKKKKSNKALLPEGFSIEL